MPALKSKLLKGALVEFSDRFIGSVPNVIIFQFNPEMITRTLEVWTPAGGATSTGNDTAGTHNSSQTAQPFDPPETFTLALEMDAADELEFPELHPITAATGIASRLAALELLLYPQQSSLLGGLLGDAASSLNGAASGGVKAVPRGTVPVLLFVWGPGRIVPVRLTSFSIEEQAYSPLLYPIRAKVSVGIRILSPKDFTSCQLKTSEELAIAAFNYSRKQKEILAASNIANNVQSILGMLPF